MMDGPRTRRRAPQGPLPLDNVARMAAGGTTVGRDVMGGMPSGGRQQTRKRGDRLEELLREVTRQEVVDRVGPR